MYSIGEIISTYRKKKGLLQQDLADELAKEGITISYKAISNWERNLAEPRDVYKRQLQAIFSPFSKRKEPALLLVSH